MSATSSTDVLSLNLGLRERTSVDEVADIVIDVMGLENVKRKYTGGPRGWKGDNPLVQLSVERIKRLGWRPNTSPKEAIRQTAKWTMKELKRKGA